ncbi:hypothetical protein FOC4_g10005740 [Fusarium odoratissimum]|uniref:Uncharacterized protein n=1 Tax=Fusarium oxysporum f. sp. cubense (strain race 4) TaxID=2502994 RepID=N1RZF5_FUSC4|nr:hypothetical protein FOC4_g10005740 [Fusarium odoratissimum]
MSYPSWRLFINKKEDVLQTNHNSSTLPFSGDLIDDERGQYIPFGFTAVQLDRLFTLKSIIKANAVLQPALESPPQTYSSGRVEYRVKALVGSDRHQIDALPDTGAKRNFVSQQLVGKLGLIPKVSTKEEFRLPTGATIKSCGTVDVPFIFLGESEQHMLDCCILSKCRQDLILCQAFLKATGTLTKFTHHITKSLRKFATRLRFNLIGNDTCCLKGSLDDIPSVALADTGCDAMLVSTDFAKRHSLEIDRSMKHRRTIEYADRSLDTTSGIVHRATWQFRSSWDKIPCTLYVLDDLKADIVLSSHFIFEHDVFSQFEEDIVGTSLVPGRDFGDIYNIRLISHYSSALQNLEASSIADMSSPNSFSPKGIKAERVRRDLIRDAINDLPPEQQDQARIDERNRQEIWDGYRKRHLERQGGNTDSTQRSLMSLKRGWESQDCSTTLYGENQLISPKTCPRLAGWQKDVSLDLSRNAVIGLAHQQLLCHTENSIDDEDKRNDSRNMDLQQQETHPGTIQYPDLLQRKLFGDGAPFNFNSIATPTPTLKLWVGARMAQELFCVVENNDFDIDIDNDANSIHHGQCPVPPVLDHQLDVLMIQEKIRTKDWTMPEIKNILKGGNSRSKCFKVYLTVVMLLDNPQYVYK